MQVKKQNNIVIGISGFARSGKDTLSVLLKDHLRSIGIRTKIFSFAHALKNDIDDFCISKIGISSFSEDTNEKAKIRPLLIAYGEVQRTISSGTYWLKKLKPEVDAFFEDMGRVAIISDLRFKEYENQDEVDFVRFYESNMIITVSRILGDGTPNPPAHNSEAENFPKIAEIADYNLTWNTNSDHKELASQSRECLELINSKFFNL